MMCGALIALNSACSTSEEQDVLNAPPISAEELPEIIAEILLIDPAIREAPRANQDSLARVYYLRVLSPRGYNLDDFTQSMQWLQRDPKRLQNTYEDVLEFATTFETELRD